MSDIRNILQKHEIVDSSALDEYIELVSLSDDPLNGYTEEHHICPKSMFPEYSTSKWNIVSMTFDRHCKAHELLYKMYQNDSMKRALWFMSGFDESTRILTSDAFSGEHNPAKRPEIREKISNSKLGVVRPDLIGKSFFGASQEKIENGINSMKEKLAGTVIVKDSLGDRFRVSVNDPRYISGELIPFNRGDMRENSASKRPEVINTIMSSRSKSYEKFSRFTFDEMVEFLVDASNAGKNIFAKSKPFSKNYSGYVKRTKFNENDLYNSVVQRLSKSAEAN